MKCRVHKMINYDPPNNVLFICLLFYSPPVTWIRLRSFPLSDHAYYQDRSTRISGSGEPVRTRKSPRQALAPEWTRNNSMQREPPARIVSVRGYCFANQTVGVIAQPFAAYLLAFKATLIFVFAIVRHRNRPRSTPIRSLTPCLDKWANLFQK